MPIYEYRCNSCGRRAQIFFRSFSAVEEARCPHCQSTALDRVPSRVGIVRSESSYQDFLSDPSNFEGIDYEDPRAVANWARKIGQAAGVDVGSEYAEMVEGLEHGEGPEGFGDDYGGGDFGDDLD